MIRVLVVEDSPLMGKVLTNMMNADPQILVVAVASNGKEAVEVVPLLKPDFITMDMDMPVMNGEVMVRSLRTISPGIRVISATGLQRPEAHHGEILIPERRMFLPKPFTADQVKQHVIPVLEKA